MEVAMNAGNKCKHFLSSITLISIPQTLPPLLTVQGLANEAEWWDLLKHIVTCGICLVKLSNHNDGYTVISC